MLTAASIMILDHPGWGPGWGAGPWWPVFPLVGILVWATITVTTVVLWRRRNHPTRSARSLLAEEFARGNITEQEYEQRLAALHRLHGK
jgi:putative membrane protein